MRLLSLMRFEGGACRLPAFAQFSSSVERKRLAHRRFLEKLSKMRKMFPELDGTRQTIPSSLAGMLINLAGLGLRFLLVMAEFSWQQLLRFYVKEEITSLNDVVDSVVPGEYDRGRALRRDLPQDLFDPNPSRFKKRFLRNRFLPAAQNASASYQQPLSRRFRERGLRSIVVERMAEELLEARNQNVVVLSWLGGSGPPYTQAVANIRLVGVMAAHFLAFLAREAGTRMEEVHVVGHSLGAHMASYIGSTLKDMGVGRLGRITGLDPAGPHFENADPRVRLDPEDALFVDVIHTDGTPLAAGGFGMLQPSGHVDFYPDSGAGMPGCGLSPGESLEMNGSAVFGLTQFLFCNHLRAIDYFIESISSPCPFLAQQCSNWVEYTRGSCVSCGQRGELCRRMGYHAIEAWDPDLYDGKPRQLYLFTGPLRPFCQVTHVVTVVMADHQVSPELGWNVGKFYITLHGSLGSSSKSWLGDEDLLFGPGQGFRFLVPSLEIGEIEEIIVEWEHGEIARDPATRWFLFNSRIIIDRVIVQTLEHRATADFCGWGGVLASGAIMVMRRDDNRGCLQQPLPKLNLSLRGSLRNFRLQENIEEFLRRTGSKLAFSLPIKAKCSGNIDGFLLGMSWIGQTLRPFDRVGDVIPSIAYQGRLGRPPSEAESSSLRERKTVGPGARLLARSASVRLCVGFVVGNYLDEFRPLRLPSKIEHHVGTILYFYGPVAFLLLVNVVFFALTSHHLIRHARNTAHLTSRQKPTQNFWLYLKLFVVMGLSWTTEVISYLVKGPEEYWIFTDAINCLQGLFIFIIVICKKEALKVLRRRAVRCLSRLGLANRASSLRGARSQGGERPGSTRLGAVGTSRVSDENDSSFTKASDLSSAEAVASSRL
ncbi:unnamed protein product [Darwinula stevensoni]|uniref:Lipase domain-containing protein n=1 Tax=Darwinula stevensoni TaxID=69355 RepID=A0A7R9AEP7_9CRUS|nr:unnamed protein product [Darwinula stevensoni]CAG0901835.1 unnamed protein product [Darwinula stevensoni]